MGPDLSLDIHVGKARVLHRGDNSPWLEIEVPDGWIGIWLETGAIYRADKNGAMEDDAIVLPAPDTNKIDPELVQWFADAMSPKEENE